jgi:uncharacterized Tic20 family protein
MTESIPKHERNLSAVIHGATLGRFFVPFGQFLLPLVFWLPNRNQYAFVDYHGRQALNFQISMALYHLLLGMVSVPFFLGFFPNVLEWNSFEWGHWNGFWPFRLNFNTHFSNVPGLWWPLGMAGLLQLGLYGFNIAYSILATIKASEGVYFKYPVTISFLKP